MYVLFIIQIVFSSDLPRAKIGTIYPLLTKFIPRRDDFEKVKKNFSYHPSPEETRQSRQYFNMLHPFLREAYREETDAKWMEVYRIITSAKLQDKVHLLHEKCMDAPFEHFKTNPFTNRQLGQNQLAYLYCSQYLIFMTKLLSIDNILYYKLNGIIDDNINGNISPDYSKINIDSPEYKHYYALITEHFGLEILQVWIRFLNIDRFVTNDTANPLLYITSGLFHLNKALSSKRSLKTGDIIVEDNVPSKIRGFDWLKYGWSNLFKFINLYFRQDESLLPNNIDILLSQLLHIFLYEHPYTSLLSSILLFSPINSKRIEELALYTDTEELYDWENKYKVLDIYTLDFGAKFLADVGIVDSPVTSKTADIFNELLETGEIPTVYSGITNNKINIKRALHQLGDLLNNSENHSLFPFLKLIANDEFFYISDMLFNPLSENRHPKITAMNRLGFPKFMKLILVDSPNFVHQVSTRFIPMILNLLFYISKMSDLSHSQKLRFQVIFVHLLNLTLVQVSLSIFIGMRNTDANTNLVFHQETKYAHLWLYQFLLPSLETLDTYKEDLTYRIGEKTIPYINPSVYSLIIFVNRKINEVSLLNSEYPTMANVFENVLVSLSPVWTGGYIVDNNSSHKSITSESDDIASSVSLRNIEENKSSNAMSTLLSSPNFLGEMNSIFNLLEECENVVECLRFLDVIPDYFTTPWLINVFYKFNMDDDFGRYLKPFNLSLYNSRPKYLTKESKVNCDTLIQSIDFITEIRNSILLHADTMLNILTAIYNGNLQTFFNLLKSCSLDYSYSSMIYRPNEQFKSLLLILTYVRRFIYVADNKFRQFVHDNFLADIIEKVFLKNYNFLGDELDAEFNYDEDSLILNFDTWFKRSLSESLLARTLMPMRFDEQEETSTNLLLNSIPDYFNFSKNNMVSTLFNMDYQKIGPCITIGHVYFQEGLTCSTNKVLQTNFEKYRIFKSDKIIIQNTMKLLSLTSSLLMNNVTNWEKTSVKKNITFKNNCVNLLHSLTMVISRTLHSYITNFKGDVIYHGNLFSNYSNIVENNVEMSSILQEFINTGRPGEKTSCLARNFKNTLFNKIGDILTEFNLSIFINMHVHPARPEIMNLVRFTMTLLSTVISIFLHFERIDSVVSGGVEHGSKFNAWFYFIDNFINVGRYVLKIEDLYVFDYVKDSFRANFMQYLTFMDEEQTIPIYLFSQVVDHLY